MGSGNRNTKPTEGKFGWLICYMHYCCRLTFAQLSWVPTTAFKKWCWFFYFSWSFWYRFVAVLWTTLLLHGPVFDHNLTDGQMCSIGFKSSLIGVYDWLTNCKAQRSFRSFCWHSVLGLDARHSMKLVPDDLVSLHNIVLEVYWFV